MLICTHAQLSYGAYLVLLSALLRIEISALHQQKGGHRRPVLHHLPYAPLKRNISTCKSPTRHRIRDSLFGLALK